jgi:2-methylcitrate dehydratase PrpD
MQGLTASLAAFATRPQALVLDEAVRRTVRNGFTDTVAVILAGRDEAVTGIVRGFVSARRSGADNARVLFGAQRAASRDAALINATAGHALDYDDVGLLGHPSVVLVPALLAEGECLQAGGEAMLRAYVIGYEVWAELIGRDADLHHRKGWHPTAVFGVVAVAAAVAALRGLNAATAQHALGLAASMAGGLVANFGSMAKPFHAGQAAAQGIDAVDLACAGMTAAADVLEHPVGLLAALSPQGRVERGPPATQPGRVLRIASLGLTVKKYPMCFSAHRVIDATLDLRRLHGVRPGEVKAIDARVGPAQAAMLRNHAPGDALAAKFSLEFAIAASLVAGKIGLAELDPAFVRSAEVQQLFGKVRIAIEDSVCAEEPTLAASDRICLQLHDGRVLDSGEVSGTRGDPRTPLAAHELEAKFMDCTAAVAGLDRARLFSALQQLERLQSPAYLPLPGT